MKLIWLLLAVLFPLLSFGAQFTNSTSATFQDRLTGSPAAGDTIWLRGGIYFPPSTNASSNNELGWLVAIKGATNNLITIRSYPGEVARIDRQWRFGTDETAFFLRFRDLWFYDSLKGYRNLLPIGSDPDQDGPWGHFSSQGSVSDQNEWVNCFFHDVHNIWDGGTSGRSIRGCIVLNAGWTFLEHLVYELYGDFTGNITGFQSSDAINLNSIGAVNVSSNIFFGNGQTVISVNTGVDIRLNNPGTIAWNSIYNYFPTDRAVSAVLMGSGIVTNNTIASAAGGIVFPSGTPSISNNTFHMNSSVVNYPIHTAGNLGGGINLNYYTARPGRVVKFKISDVDHTFTQWITNGVDTFSTSTNGVYPPDSVKVYPNADEAKRAHIAIFNWSGAHNVNVNLTGVLNAGDAYQVISGQNYGAGVIWYGIYNGTNISVPMTNLTTAPILYGQNDNVFSENIVQAPVTSPEFGAFVVVGGETDAVGVAAVTTVNAGSITLSPP